MATACGGGAKGDTPQGGVIAGAAGEPDASEPDAAGGSGGEGGAADVGSSVTNAAEQGLGRDDVILDVDVLDGMTFTLDGSLCPADRDLPFMVDGAFYHEIDSLPGLHLQKSKAGGLEAVTFTRAEGLATVQVTPLTPAGLGWDLEHVATCAWLEYWFEDEYVTNRYEAAHVHLVFTPSQQGASQPELRLAASVPHGAPRSSHGVLDTEAPSVGEVTLAPLVASIDDFSGYDFERRFFFDKPVAVSSKVSLLDSVGGEAKVVQLESNGYLVGFTLKDLLSSSASLSWKVQDLAGVEWHGNRPYPGIDVAVADPGFEADTKILTDADWAGADGPDCEATGVRASLTLGSDAKLAPLAGKASLSINRDCDVFVRVQIPPGATQLLFEAREVCGPFDDCEATESLVDVTASSLDAGSDRISLGTDTAPWPPDATASTTTSTVSELRTLSFPLKAVGADVLLRLHTERPLWLDSLRFE